MFDKLKTVLLDPVAAVATIQLDRPELFNPLFKKRPPLFARPHS